MLFVPGTRTAESGLLMLRSSFAALLVLMGMKDGWSSIVGEDEETRS